MCRRYKQGVLREEEALLPARVEDYVSPENVVRAIDAYVDTLDLAALGFVHAQGELSSGQPAFSPACLLKLYLAGFLNRVHSSRRLALECKRNLEFIWLLEGLRPGFRCIAEFRQSNSAALQQCSREFVMLCRELRLLGRRTVAIDGAFFHGNASRASTLTDKRLRKELAKLELQIATYYQQLDEQDRAEQGAPAQLDEVPDLAAKITALKARQQLRQRQLQQLQESGERQLGQTDPDARILHKAHQDVVGYNVQSTVETRHKLIIHHEVTHAGNDAEQLATQAIAAKQILLVKKLIAEADTGYYSEEQLAACAQAGITAYVPPPNKYQIIEAQGRLSGASFTYDAQRDAYLCPGNQSLYPRGKPTERRGQMRTCYTCKASLCKACPLKDQCLPPRTPYRRIFRTEHASLIEAHRQRMARTGAQHMRERAATVEHPFGTLKCWFGYQHLLTRGFEKVRGEMSLAILAYNLLRVIHVLGIEKFKKICVKRRAIAQQAMAS